MRSKLIHNCGKWLLGRMRRNRRIISDWRLDK
jgi:hypothetical protein